MRDVQANIFDNLYDGNFTNEEIEEFKAYVLNNQYELLELFNKLNNVCANGYDYMLKNKDIEHLITYICLLQTFAIRYQNLKKQRDK